MSSKRRDSRPRLRSTAVGVAILGLAFAMIGAAPAKAFCVFGCEPTEVEVRKVFENLIKQKFDPDAKIVEFVIDRFWRLDVTGANGKGLDFFFHAKVEFPKGANPDCKPEGSDNHVKEGCSASTYYSTTIQNQMINERQFIAPGKIVDFKDETRFDEVAKGWKAQDGDVY
ncbi:MAG: hypothetical protein WB816_07250 [Methylocystis sp.]